MGGGNKPRFECRRGEGNAPLQHAVEKYPESLNVALHDIVVTGNRGCIRKEQPKHTADVIRTECNSGPIRGSAYARGQALGRARQPPEESDLLHRP